MDEGRGFTIIDYEDRYKAGAGGHLPALAAGIRPAGAGGSGDAGGAPPLPVRRWPGAAGPLGERLVGMVMLELQGKGQCELLKFGVKEA